MRIYINISLSLVLTLTISILIDTRLVVSGNIAKTVDHDVSIFSCHLTWDLTCGWSIHKEVSVQPITVAFACRLSRINMAAF